MSTIIHHKPRMLPHSNATFILDPIHEKLRHHSQHPTSYFLSHTFMLLEGLTQDFCIYYKSLLQTYNIQDVVILIERETAFQYIKNKGSFYHYAAQPLFKNHTVWRPWDEIQVSLTEVKLDLRASPKK